MKLKILCSNSLGNCYILENNSEALIIEAGIKLKEVKKALNFNLRKVAACIVTHSHHDHAGYIEQLMTAGITVLALEETFQAKNIDEAASFRKRIQPGHGYKAGNFKILAFTVAHDVPCLGFVIEHLDSGKILFLTDTMTCGYSFSGLNHLMIEANYSDDQLTKNIQSETVPLSLRARLLASHMEFETTKQIIKNQDLSQVRNIVLIHLSDRNSDEKRFVSEIKSMTGKSVHAAQKGIEIEFNKEPF